KPKVTWNGRLVPDGGRIRVPITFSTSGEKFIKEAFVCEGSDAAEKMMFSCIIPGYFLPATTGWLYRSREIFTFTTENVDKLISCTCSVSYSSLWTETSLFYLTSQADIKKGLMGMSMSLLSSVLTSV
ncbi:unnamed protein product, partial [Lymnaea stagnalis]